MRSIGIQKNEMIVATMHRLLYAAVLCILAACGGGHDSPSPDRGTIQAAHRETFLALPTSYYLAFDYDLYAMCFDCHDNAIVLAQETTRTGFRNGTRNLHFVHTSRAKGDNCKCCHILNDAGDVEFASTVPFGQYWELPVNITLTEFGGNCVVGCHKGTEYIR